MCSFVLAFPLRKLLIAEFKNTQVTYVGWNLKSSKSTINLFKNNLPHLALTEKGGPAKMFQVGANKPQSCKTSIYFSLQQHRP